MISPVKIIVDVNLIHKVLMRSDDVEYSQVSKALFYGTRFNLSLVCGGTRFLGEYERIKGLKKILLELDRIGRLSRCSNVQVDVKENALIASRSCISNDSHIIALAFISSCKVLLTRDDGLIKDFKKIIKGRVYSSSKHRNLLV